MLKKTICIILAAVMLSFSVAATERASLFVGDTVWQNDSLLPFIEADGAYLLPVSVFGEFGINITLSELLGSLLIEKDGKYLSYNLSFGTVIDESGEIKETKIYRYGGEIYLEPTALCEKFALTFTTVYAADGYLAARLTSGNETLDFSELLSMHTDSGETPMPFLYNPTGKTVGGTFMYPILLMPAAANVKNLIDLIGDHDATFAISPDRLTAYKDVLPDIFAAGHTVAFYMDNTDMADTDTFREEMDAANDWLFAYLGKTARIYVSTEMPAATPDIDGYHKKSCRMHLVVDDLQSERMINITLSVSPGYGVFNFSLASDRDSRTYYKNFFNKFDTFETLRSMSLTESSPSH